MSATRSLLLVALTAAACGGSSSATRGGGSGDGRSSHPAPAWFGTPPKSTRSLFFVGDATGAADESSARDLAIQKAIAQLTVYCGASIKSEARSEERETNGKHEYVVSMTVDVAGDELTVREAVVKETVVGKGSDGLYDGYALLEWPKEQYEAVLAMQRQRAARALALFLDAEKAAEELDTPAAGVSLKEAKTILGPMKSAVPLVHDRYNNTGLLWDAMKALGERIEQIEKGRKSVFSVAVECVREGKPTTCNASRAGAVRQAVVAGGKKIAAEAVPAQVAAEILSAENPKPDKQVRSAGFVVAVRYTADLQAIDGPFTFVRAGARVVVYDVSSGRIVSAHEIAPQKEGHPNFEGAMEKGWTNAEKQILAWVRAEAEKIK